MTTEVKPRAFDVSCPAPPGSDRVQIVVLGSERVAVTAIFLEVTEFFVAYAKDPKPGVLRVLYWLPFPGELAEAKASPPPGYHVVNPAQFMTPARFLYFSEQAAISRENDLYSQCQALVMNLDNAAKDPARATACNGAMAVIDRNRATRRENENRRIQQAQTDELRAEIERSRQAQVDELRRIRRAASVPKTCTPNYAGGFYCY